MKGIDAWTHNSEKIVSCRCRASTSRSCLSSSSSIFVFFRFANPRLLNFHRRKKEAKTEKKNKQNKTKQKQNKTDRTLLWRSKRHTCLRKAAQLKRPSPTDSRLKKCTTFRHLACTRVIKLASVFFVRGEVGFRLFFSFFFFPIWHIVLLCFDTYKGFFCGKKN